MPSSSVNRTHAATVFKANVFNFPVQFADKLDECVVLVNKVSIE